MMAAIGLALFAVGAVLQTFWASAVPIQFRDADWRDYVSGALILAGSALLLASLWTALWRYAP